ncbi:lytic murein transglycosylase [Sinorhizobium sp. BG8]|uniref:lytic murein transglycosylase n=1 Tax=Sinorhizobium sp. BG8 TaxID=2613773 RepID=UPI00193D2159|nr:lytic murein transglycosylase [Sinorhizobium sp. BG8]QRM56666.1 lytic murein transglycosylase [Sinorhizobium sp. BG8]
MNQDRKNIFRRSALALLLSAGLFGSTGAAQANSGFQTWIANFYATAAKSGITKATYQKAFSGVKTPDPTVLEKAAYQPEFKHQIWDYLDSRVNPYTVKIGQEMGRKHARTLAAIERHFGVDRNILLAIWSMESNYGAVLDKDEKLHYVPRALATLAYADEKRSKYARNQLIAALKIIQNGDVPASEMTGSWAGAMGHTQFIPSSYLLYAIDADGNGHRDIWNSVPDALATAANLLHKNGWQPGKTWGYETVIPQGGTKYSGQTKTLAQWAKLGFKRPGGGSFKFPNDRAELKIPSGGNGPAFLMTKNFFVIKRYNASDSYAMGVGMLADQLSGYGGVKQRWPRPDGALDISEKFELQTRLKELGYYEGEVDGNFGSGSKAAIQAFQNRMGLAADGQPSQTLLNALRR